jgi:tetratricopeptide (TPR) repeat protein
MMSKINLIILFVIASIFSCSGHSSFENARQKTFNLAQKYYDQEQYDDAIKIINCIIDSDSLDYEAIYFRARCNFFLDNYDETIEDLLIVAHAGYREFDAYYNIGNIYWILAQYSHSVKYFKMALNYDPYNKEVIEIIEVLEEAVEIFENPNILF